MIFFKRIFKKISLICEASLSNLDNEFKWSNIFSWSSSSSSMQNRILLVAISFLVIFITIITRIFTFAHSDLIKVNNKVATNIKVRHDIFDRNGNLLVTNLPTASLFARPPKILDPKEVVSKLSNILPDLDKEQLIDNLNSKKKFVWIKRDLSLKEQEDIYNLGIAGLEFEEGQKRVYVYGNLFSHVIGYVNRDMDGQAGLEQYFDNELLGNKTSELLQNSGLVLSLDLKLQTILSDEIEKTIQKFDAKGGAGIIINPKNGEILAMISKPDFDPHRPGDYNDNERFNMVSQGVYEVGSSIKGLTIAIGFDTSTVSMHDAYNTSYMKIGKFHVRDYHKMNGWSSVPQIFLHSSNIGLSQIIIELGKDKLRQYFKKLGLLDGVSLELPERTMPLFAPYSRWTDLTLATMSYGYGLSITPLHLVQAMTPIVNGGTKYPLTLIKRNLDKKLAGENVIKKSTSDDIRKLLYLVVSEGTGKRAAINGYYVGGKTGTAEKAINGKYNKKKMITSFFGVMPVYDPQYMIYVTIDEPKGIKESFGFATAGWNAAVAVGQIFKRIATIYGIEKLDELSKEIQNLKNIEYEVSNDA